MGWAANGQRRGQMTDGTCAPNAEIPDAVHGLGCVVGCGVMGCVVTSPPHTPHCAAVRRAPSHTPRLTLCTRLRTVNRFLCSRWRIRALRAERQLSRRRGWRRLFQIDYIRHQHLEFSAPDVQPCECVETLVATQKALRDISCPGMQ